MEKMSTLFQIQTAHYQVMGHPTRFPLSLHRPVSGTPAGRHRPSSPWRHQRRAGKGQPRFIAGELKPGERLNEALAQRTGTRCGPVREAIRLRTGLAPAKAVVPRDALVRQLFVGAMAGEPRPACTGPSMRPCSKAPRLGQYQPPNARSFPAGATPGALSRMQDWPDALV